MNDIVILFEKTFGKKENIEAYLKFFAFFILLICLFTRISMYLFPKDIWLDEASLYIAINSSGLLDLLHGNLRGQSAPLLFVILNKFILLKIGNSQICIYFIPFICSFLSVIILSIICYKISDIFYVFSALFIFSLCFTATYYTVEFKQYSTELFISLLILYAALKNFDKPNWQETFFSAKSILFYSVCILCSSTSILFITGIIAAKLVIAWRKNMLRYSYFLNISILVGFIAIYYFFYLKTGNSQNMKNYWQSSFIPLNWEEFWKYWPDIGYEIFLALFDRPEIAGLIFLGLVGGSFILWRNKPNLFLLFSMPVVVTVAANFFFYPPGHRWAPHGGRLLLFLIPNAVLVAAWFYAWLLNRLATFTGLPVIFKGPVAKRLLHAWRIVFISALGGLVFVSVLANARYLYTKEYHFQQLGELVRIFQCNRTPESLNLIYRGAQRAYQYYEEHGDTPQVEILPLDLASLKTRLEYLPENRRILILFGHYWGVAGGIHELEGMFAAQGREFIKIPAKNALLYILPKK